MFFNALSLKLQDKFRLDLTDEEAVQYMQNLIDVSVGAVFAAVVEQIHKFAQVINSHTNYIKYVVKYVCQVPVIYGI